MQRSYITYTSIYNIIADMHSMVDSIDWDEDKVLEWAVKGLRKINLPAKYEDAVVMLDVKDHSTQLPDDIKYINQLFYKVTANESYNDLIAEVNEGLGIVDTKANYHHMTYPDNLAKQVLNLGYIKKRFQPLRRESGSFGTEPCTFDKVPNTRQCDHRYTIYGKQSIQTTFRNGCVLLSYKRYVRDCDGLDLVPDNEDLKDALFHFCMYRWWMSRLTYKEEGSNQQMLFHKQQYDILKRKAAANLNSPDIDELENIKNTRNRLVPRENFYDKGFGQLSNRENIDF